MARSAVKNGLSARCLVQPQQMAKSAAKSGLLKPISLAAGTCGTDYGGITRDENALCVG